MTALYVLGGVAAVLFALFRFGFGHYRYPYEEEFDDVAMEGEDEP